jgi:hypothetical protein
MAPGSLPTKNLLLTILNTLLTTCFIAGLGCGICVEWSCVMSSFPVSVRTLFVAAISLLSLTNVALAKDIVSCRSFAEAAANDWADGRIFPADNATTAQPDEIVLISAGHKFIVPRHATRSDRVTLQPLGALVSDRNQVYDEELARCLHTRELNVYVNR